MSNFFTFAVPGFSTLGGLQETVLVSDYPNPAAAAAVAAGKTLVFPPTPQTYTVVDLVIPAGCYVVGNNNTVKFANGLMTDGADDKLLDLRSGVTVDNLNFDGNIAGQTGTWSEYMHCIRIDGNYSNVTVRNCDFLNIIGDGIYIRTGTAGDTGTNITIGPNNTFTGANNCRNGVSIISGDTIEIFSNTFTTLSRPEQPGSIDIEPNLSTEHVAHINIHNNTFLGGPSAGLIGDAAIKLAMEADADADDIQIRNNDISGTGFDIGIFIKSLSTLPTYNRAGGIVVDNNNIHGILSSGTGVALFYKMAADVINNTFNGMSQGVWNYQACLTDTTGNTFTSVGTSIVQDSPDCQAAGAPKVATLTDGFATKNTTLWTWTGASGVTAGQLSLPATTDITSAAAYDLTESAMYVEAVSLVAGGGTWMLFFAGAADSNNYMYTLRAGTTLWFGETVAGVADETQITWSATTHRWLRMRHSGTTVFWDTSPDKVTWTNRRSKTQGLTYTSGYARIYSQSGAGNCLFDNFNL